MLPGVLHFAVADVRGQIVEVPSEDPTVLVTYDLRATPPDLVVLQHVATAAAVLLVQQGSRREHRRRLGAELLAALIDSGLSEHELSEQLDRANLAPESSVLVAIRGGSEPGESHLHLTLDRRTIPHLLLRRADVLYALVADTSQTILTIRRRLGPQALIGVSDPLISASRAAAAAREAAWAMRDAAATADNLCRYAEATSLTVLRDATEAQLLVDRQAAHISMSSTWPGPSPRRGRRVRRNAPHPCPVRGNSCAAPDTRAGSPLCRRRDAAECSR